MRSEVTNMKASAFRASTKMDEINDYMIDLIGRREMANVAKQMTAMWSKDIERRKSVIDKKWSIKQKWLEDLPSKDPDADEEPPQENENKKVGKSGKKPHPKAKHTDDRTYAEAAKNKPKPSGGNKDDTNTPQPSDNQATANLQSQQYQKNKQGKHHSRRWGNYNRRGHNRWMQQNPNGQRSIPSLLGPLPPPPPPPQPPMPQYPPQLGPPMPPNQHGPSLPLSQHGPSLPLSQHGPSAPLPLNQHGPSAPPPLPQMPQPTQHGSSMPPMQQGVPEPYFPRQNDSMQNGFQGHLPPERQPMQPHRPVLVTNPGIHIPPYGPPIQPQTVPNMGYYTQNPNQYSTSAEVHHFSQSRARVCQQSGHFLE